MTQLPRRDWKTVTVQPDPAGWAVRLDEKPLRTPARTPLAVPHRSLAEMIAQEWAAQGEIINPGRVPATRLAATTLDRTAPDPARVVATLMSHAETDLLCYRAETPAELARRQVQHWQPLVDWATLRFDAPILIATGIMPRPQPPAALAALSHAVASLDPYRLTGLAAAAGEVGSLILGLALVHGRLDAEGVWLAALVDEHFQTERWGEDDEATAARAELKSELIEIERYLRALA